MIHSINNPYQHRRFLTDRRCFVFYLTLNGESRPGKRKRGLTPRRFGNVRITLLSIAFAKRMQSNALLPPGRNHSCDIPISSPSGPAQWLFQELASKGIFLLCVRDILAFVVCESVYGSKAQASRRSGLHPIENPSSTSEKHYP